MKTRTAKQCWQRWNVSLKPGIRKGAWTIEEDRVLIAAHKRLGEQWTEIAKELDGRTLHAIRSRWMVSLQKKANATIKTGAWTQAEDARLRRLAKRHGAEKKWSVIAKAMKTRTAKQCWSRWNRSLKPGIRRGAWTAEEDRVLIAAHKRFGDQWSEIAKELDGRTGDSIRMHWKDNLQKKANATIKTGAWTQAEDARLWKLVKRYGADKKWSVIAKAMKTRTETQCSKRWNVSLKPDIRKGAWTAEEDGRLRKLVKQYGADKKWSVIAKAMKTRTATQCRDRWNRYLKPGIRKGAWTAEEDRVLIAAHKSLGDQWSEIAKELDGRTGTAILKRWTSKTLQKKINAAIECTAEDEAMKDVCPTEGDVAAGVGAAAGTASGQKTKNANKKGKEQPPPAASAQAAAPLRLKRSRGPFGVHNRFVIDGRVYRSKRRNLGPPSHTGSASGSGSGGAGNSSGAAQHRASSSRPMYLDELLQILREEGLM